MYSSEQSIELQSGKPWGDFGSRKDPETSGDEQHGVYHRRQAETVGLWTSLH